MTMINMEDKNQAASVMSGAHGVSSGANGANNPATGGGSNAIPRCVCGWKNCRVYQKAFREGNYTIWDGVIKIRFIRGDAESMALKSSIDRHLRVDATKRNEWKTVKGLDICRYTIARHHFTEKHIEKYLVSNPQAYSFLKPFTLQGAKKYLYSLDNRDTLQNDNGDLFYVQVPNNSKEHVKSVFLGLKDKLGGGSGGGGRSNTKGDADTMTVTTNRSSSQELLAKEQENAKLKDQLEAMQSQLTFLHDMVKKLQEEHLDSRSVRSSGRRQSVSGHGGGGGGGGRRGSTTGNRGAGSSAHSRSRRTISSRSGRSGVPKEIELGEEEEGSQWNENDWSEHNYDEDDTTVATFRVSYRAERRSSISSAVSRTSRATSIVSASKSLKSLPREIELDEDEEDSESHESLEEEAFDNRSMASNWRGSVVVQEDDYDQDEYDQEAAEKYGYEPMNSASAGASANGRSNTGGSTTSSHNKSPASRTSAQNVSGAQSVSSRNTDNRRSSLGAGSTDMAAGAGTYQVQALVVTDPYGEQGTYTGSISNATNMPHGYGRLEYDRAGRWYEGDWKHGRWTGKGRLSNGDGDYYEGGLKNDHKHGFGIMKFADGRIFEGEYINGQMIEGKMTYQDGSTYTGSWVDGMRHGRGRCVFTDQSVYEGEFQEGEFFGHGKMTWSDGGWYEGKWVYGEMDGWGKEVRPDGTLRHEGEWRKGQPIRK